MWSTWNYINVFCVFFSGYVAYGCFRDGYNRAGWLNLFASSLNGAIVLMRLL